MTRDEAVKLCNQVGITQPANKPSRLLLSMCQTCIPGDGWPLDRHPEVREWMLGIAFTPNPNDEETF